jgi:glycosyltransferase involved in cell wall biosynthesis
MKVLHIWNIAAVPSILSKYLRKKGVISDVIMRKQYDKYGFERIYSDFTINYDVSAEYFYYVALKKSSNYDVLHVHSLDKIVPLLKIYHRKPVVLHYHGTDIRGRGKSVIKTFYRRFSNLLLVSTPDLITDLPSATYLPNPIDTDIFKPDKGCMCEGEALFFLKHPDDEKDLDSVEKIAEERGLTLRVYNRTQGDLLSHIMMPTLYNKYEYFINRVKIQSLSKMALEALACGLKVIKDRAVLSTFPEQHRPYRVIDQLVKLYEDIS